MSNLKSLKTTSYQICRTDNKDHLNGFIFLIDFDNGIGMAVVYVSEKGRSDNKLVWHAATELIVSSGQDEWHTMTPHIRRNEQGKDVEQDWVFKKINGRQEVPCNEGECHDNNKNYGSYISYSLKSRCPDNRVCALQGDGTGTGGNGDIGK